MWGRSYSDHSVYADPHRLALYVDIAESVKRDRSSVLQGIRSMCRRDREASSGSAGVGFHVLFHLEIDIETNEFEIEDKLELMNEVRQVVEDVFYADCNNAADGGGAVRGKAYVLPDDAVDAEEAEERRLREVKDEEDRVSKYAKKVAVKDPIVRARVSQEKAVALLETYERSRLYLTMSCNIVSPFIMSYLLDNPNKKYQFKKRVDVFLITYQLNRQRTVETVLSLHKTYGGRLHLGLSFDVPHDELQWIILKIPEGVMKVILLGFLSYLPNLYLRQVDIVHSFSLSAIVVTRKIDLFQPEDRLAYLNEYSDKYKNSTAAEKTVISFFFKCLLQLGMVIAVDENIDHSIISNDIWCLKHPFVGRKTFSSANEKKRYVVSESDMLAVCELSESRENVNDKEGVGFATHRKPPRELTNKVLLEKISYSRECQEHGGE